MKFKKCILLILIALLPFISSATIINPDNPVTYRDKKYFVDVINASSTSIVKVEIWFREKNNASSVGDFEITELKARTDDMQHYLDLTCRAKKDFAENKGLLGCMSTVGSVFCAAGTAATDGVMAFICETTWTYSVDGGAADCLKLTSEAIAKFLGKEKEWKPLALIAQIPDIELTEAISSAIDYMCEDIINNSTKD